MVCSFAIVPIFVNAGAALLPSALAAVASTVMLLFRPRELARACRRRPIVAAAVPLVVVAAVFGLRAWLNRPAPRPPRAARVDWPGVAMTMLARERGGIATTATRPADGPAGLGRDFTRCGWDRCGSPRNLDLLWRHRVEDANFLCSPVVVNGRLYGATYVPDITGKFGAGSIVCIDVATQRKLWETSGANGQPFKGFFSSPAISADGRRLVIGQGLHEDADCALLCLDTADGRVCWQARTPLHIEGSPAIRGDMAVVGAGAIEDDKHKPTGHIGQVFAVRISDGQRLWQYDLADPESSPAIDEAGVVYIGSGLNGNAIVALRSETDAELKAAGKPRLIWRRAADYPVTSAVTFAGDCILVGAGNGDFVYASDKPAGVVLALDRATGAVRWSRPMPDAVLGGVAVNEKLAVCPVRDGQVVALDRATGEPVWRQRISGRSPVLAGVALADGLVYAVSKDGWLAVLDSADGRVLERHTLNDADRPGQLGLCFSSPTVAGGCVFVGSESGGLRCYAPKRKD